MSLSSEEKKRLYEELQQQWKNQKLIKYNEAKKIFTGLTDLDYKPDHNEHAYFQSLLPSNDKDNMEILEAYQTEEIYSQYIIRVGRKRLYIN